jgi:hypothetical protein
MAELLLFFNEILRCKMKMRCIAALQLQQDATTYGRKAVRTRHKVKGDASFPKHRPRDIVYGQIRSSSEAVSVSRP